MIYSKWYVFEFGGGTFNLQPYSIHQVSMVISFVKMKSVPNVLTSHTLDTNSNFTQLITCERYKHMFCVVHHMELDILWDSASCQWWQYTYLWLRYEADLTCIDWMHRAVPQLLVFKKCTDALHMHGEFR